MKFRFMSMFLLKYVKTELSWGFFLLFIPAISTSTFSPWPCDLKEDEVNLRWSIIYEKEDSNLDTKNL